MSTGEVARVDVISRGSPATLLISGGVDTVLLAEVDDSGDRIAH